jgi:hypothetical protein
MIGKRNNMKRKSIQSLHPFFILRKNIKYRTCSLFYKKLTQNESSGGDLSPAI